MRRGTILAIAATSFCLFVVWTVGFSPLRHTIEWNVAANVTDTLREGGLAGVAISVDGRTVALRGEVASDSLRLYAEQLVENTYGVRDVQNELEVAR